MSALEQAIDESATVTVRWKDREFEVEASGMDDEEELVIAVSNKIHLAPEHLRLTWAVDGACVATAIDDAPEVESESDDELLAPVVIRELPRDPAAEPAKARDHSLTNYDKYGTMYVEAEKDLDPDFKEEKPRAAQQSDIPNFKGSSPGRFPLVSADFWTSDHLLERSRSVDAFLGTRARGTLTLKRI